MKGYDPLGIATKEASVKYDPLNILTQKREESTLTKTANILRAISERTEGTAEAATTFGTGILGAVAGAATGLTTAAVTGLGKATGLGFEDVDPVEAGKAVQEGVARYITREPQTYTGKLLTVPSELPQPADVSPNALLRMLDPRRLVAAPFEVAGEMLDMPLESWNAPEGLRYPVKEIGGFAAYPATFKGIKGTKNIVRDVIKERIRKKEVKKKIEVEGVYDPLNIVKEKPVVKEVIPEEKPVVAKEKLSPEEVSDLAIKEAVKEKYPELSEEFNRLYDEKKVKVTKEYDPLAIKDKPVVERRQDTTTRTALEAMSKEEMMKELHTDKLTGLKNRRAYEDLEKEPIQASIDVDSLKAVNDTYGHEVGDLMLKEVGTALKSDKSIHISGDEFIVQGKTKAEVKAVIDKANKYLKKYPLEVIDEAGNKVSIPISFSHGIGKTLKLADTAMKADKINRSKQGLRAERGETPVGLKVEKKIKEKIEEPTIEEIAAELPDKLELTYPASLKQVEKAKAKAIEKKKVTERSKVDQKAATEKLAVDAEFVSKTGNKYIKSEGVWYDSFGEEVINNFIIKAAEKGKIETSIKHKPKLKTITEIEKEATTQLRPAILVDGKVHVAKLPKGTTHSMLWDSLAKGEVKGAKKIESGWAKSDGSGFTKTPRNIKTMLEDINTSLGEKGAIGKQKLTPEQIAAGERLKADYELMKSSAKAAGKEIGEYLKGLGFKPEDIKYLLGLDSVKQVTPKITFGLRDSARAGWEALEGRSATVRETAKTARITAKELKEIVLDPQDVMHSTPATKKIFNTLLEADESGNAFLARNLALYSEATKGIKKGTESSVRIGKALEGVEKLQNLTKQERKAYNFLKENFEYLIHEFARKACGSEKVYQKILREVGVEHPKKSKIADLDLARAEEYKTLAKQAKEIRGKRKKSELKGDERRTYEDIQQEMRDILNRDYIDSLSEGERQAYLILSRRIDQYLPHLFDPKELLAIFKSDLSRIQGKLAKATNKGSITKYKKQVNKLEEAITKMEGGGYVSFRQLPKEIFFRFFMERKGKTGYSFDAMQAYEAYLHGLARKMFDEPALKTITTDLFNKVDPSLKPYTQSLVDHFMGYDKHPMDRISSAITTFEWIRTLGFNPRSALVNLSQRVNTIASVGEKWAFKAEKMMLLEREKANALFDETGISREVPTVLTEGPPSVGMKAVNDVARYMFNRMELGNRKHAYISGYLKAKETGAKKGLGGEALETFAKKEGMKTVHETQFRYGRLGMAKMYWNPYSRIALQFTSYPLKQARFLYRLLTKDPIAFAKYIMYAEGINYTIQEFLDADMSNALGFGITWGEALSTITSLAQGDTYGALRHAGQTITPGGGMLPGGLGPAVTGGLAVVGAIGKDRGTEQLVKEITPIMLTRAIQTAKALKDKSGGTYPIYNSQGHLMYRLTGRQVGQRVIGPKTATEQKSYKRYETAKGLERERKAILADQIDAFIEGDIDTVVDLYQRYHIVPTDAMIQNEKAKRLLTPKERRKIGTKEKYQYMREGEIF